ncbi:uS9 family ribosomal protein [Candidatus Vidania fulgoroideorum]
MLGFNIFARSKKKTSVALVYLTVGNGSIKINNLPIPRTITTSKIFLPLVLSDLHKIVNICAYTKGGGSVSSLDAVRCAIAQAIVLYDTRFKNILRDHNTLIDHRTVERKKLGYLKSRKRKQFSKR